jgi:hypothetical protein
MNGQAGKGDTYRPVNRDKYNENYDRIFCKKKQKKHTKKSSK